MHLPTVQSVERKISLVGAALRYCLRFLSPATLFFLFVTVVLHLGAVTWLPLPLSTSIYRRYIAVEAASNLTAALGGVGLLICIVAALATLDPEVRKRTPLLRHGLIACVALLQNLFVVPAFQY